MMFFCQEEVFAAPSTHHPSPPNLEAAILGMRMQLWGKAEKKCQNLLQKNCILTDHLFAQRQLEARIAWLYWAKLHKIQDSSLLRWTPSVLFLSVGSHQPPPQRKAWGHLPGVLRWNSLPIASFLHNELR